MLGYKETCTLESGIIIKEGGDIYEEIYYRNNSTRIIFPRFTS